ncbi:MAG: hypothetical protein PWP07_489 [Epulopiscium sp.]|uniref:Uncharacterized protein n=1 Tax=Defluviitalea raffinosedens TaxID=1450156 RepID=A0A7C8HFW6_9FIRM|nr:hypothetical protein [Defluviitalea raffinosedens]MBZ4667789.1 hypothetical protein [Defluviitaleaceae bacterium]MDK2787264.1 hypothetical protein [Candidatus Epulonipiscium sp.]KAE9636263.1 hypothetical protein GND95_03850 [Defluviitalea raffinosedens]MBM7685438.1 hypothetical protein [Defluviitalea raffinosedens]HHW66243.1 hypothetical protein [Candidatus Epulonipiscium sp.]
MKIVMKNIDVIAWFDQAKGLLPIKFRLNEGDSDLIVKIDKICTKKEEKLAGNPMISYTCQSIIHGTLKIYEIKYEINTLKWYLYKI